MKDWGSKTCIAMLTGSAAFVAVGLWIAVGADEPQTRLNGIGAVAFFGGGIPLSILELGKRARRTRGSSRDGDRIFGIAASRIENLVMGLTAAGMAFGSYMLQYMQPEKPFIITFAWVAACFFGLAAIVLTFFGLRSRNTQ
jgi:hypothetical protein